MCGCVLNTGPPQQNLGYKANMEMVSFIPNLYMDTCRALFL